jgi:glycosyltransferase involved in cell wall biosynthesis
MMSQPTISIIIPVFNAKRTLESALRSIWEQSIRAHEIIVIDGGSTDGTLELIKSHQSNITYWVSERDRGVYDAINKGIQKATGDWVFILGSDDKLASSDVLESISAHLTDSTPLVYGSVRNVNIKHSLVPEVHMSSMGSGLYLRNTLHQQSAFYRRSLFELQQFDSSLKVLADYDFHLFLFKQGITGIRVDILIAECEASGLSKQFNRSLYAEEFRLKRKRLGNVTALLLAPIIAGKFILKQLR